MKTKFLIIFFILTSLFTFSQSKKIKTPEDVVNLIKTKITCKWSEKTVDTFKSGDQKSDLKGIAVCMFADMYVLREAVKKGCNMVITHEPAFYNHLDDTKEFASDPVYLEKKKYIDENKLVIFRFHDHIHTTEPDGISAGMINKMGIRQFSVNGSLNYFILPEKTVGSFAGEMKQKFGLEHIRIVGNPEMKFTKLAFMAGAPGGQNHVKMLRKKDVEVVIGGEAPEWETYMYAKDAASLGMNKAVIFLGHIKSEEAGMQYCGEWLKSFIKNVPIHFIPNMDNYKEL
jgi:putative NIF3 family GTP cyclohydrolase 1 type 2